MIDKPHVTKDLRTGIRIPYKTTIFVYGKLNYRIFQSFFPMQENKFNTAPNLSLCPITRELYLLSVAATLEQSTGGRFVLTT